ncbi:endo alpha-1,4 polygalactosaminidase [Microtetraspora sp. AC03309]|uniref:endo alpha-1,4 polygalactosaminidase n=1 Tax=Microtetraspora sp. AC03309 TaxID=2779376 RepID=UPI001E296120|nr:endo alpha-1,4 polygalactosaminidase [Microtetraspora sp. AC03309]MCC5574705.1 endo alpha-1,4 polygalactosaminidase [Microtetraspora sp. AC03309]
MLVGDFDFAVNEQCAQYHECSSLTLFIKAGKPLLHAEYSLAPSTFCPESKRLGLSSVRKTRDLIAKRETCPV